MKIKKSILKKLLFVPLLFIVLIFSPNVLTDIGSISDKKILRTEYTFNTRDTEFDDNTHELIIGGQRYADSNGTKVEEAKSLKNCEFCDHIPLTIGLDEKYPITEKDILDYNSTSMTLNPRVSASELNKDIPIEVYSIEKVYDEKTQEYIDEKTTHYTDTVNLKSIDEKQILILPFGFDKVVKIGEDSTTILINTTTGDGYVFVSAVTSWDSAHDDTDGSAVYVTTTMEATSADTLGIVRQIYRVFIPINTSSLEGETLESARFCGYINDTDDGDDDTEDFVVVVGNTTQASSSSLTGTDYNDCGYVDDPEEFSERVDIGDVTIGSYHCWILNANGLDAINQTGISWFGAREGHDVLDNPIAASSTNSIKFDSNEGGFPPFLNVTYASEAPPAASACNCTFPNSYTADKTINMSCYCNTTTTSWSRNLNFTSDAGRWNLSANVNVSNMTYEYLTGQDLHISPVGRLHIKG